MVVASNNPHNKEIAIRRRIASMGFGGNKEAKCLVVLNLLVFGVIDWRGMLDILNRILWSRQSVFNKREDDFPSLREYNDYLEEVEDMTFNLIEGINVAAIEAKIAKYQEENAEQIMINRARKAEELAAALAASKGQPAQTDNDVGANQTAQAGFGVPQGQYAPTFAGQPRPTGMGSQPVPLGGGDMLGYTADDEETMRLRAERGARAGGWSVEISRKRALEEAFGSIWIC